MNITSKNLQMIDGLIAECEVIRKDRFHWHRPWTLITTVDGVLATAKLAKQAEEERLRNLIQKNDLLVVEDRPRSTSS